ncbi:MAG: CaiB/BaiF CoA transferase family protein [Candidatus Helarchaeota archaeon]
MKLPLEGLKVLDLTRLLPGPLLTMMLGDYGAEVIKIEDPKIGDYVRWRPPYIQDENGNYKMNYLFLYLNRNKKSLTLDLKHEKGLEIFYKLVENSDIIVESFRPDVKNRLKIDYETVKKINDKIIYASLTGFGQTGPYKNKPGHDINYIALTGILDLNGKKGDKSVIPPVQLGDICAGAYIGFSSILLALIAREKYGIGQFIDISIYDGLISMLPNLFNEFLITKEVPNKENKRLLGLLPWYNVYKTKDGKEIAIGALEAKFWKNFCEAINRPDLIDSQNITIEEYDELKIELQKIFMKKNRDEWIKLFENVDTCISPVLNLEEILVDKHFKERNLILNYNHEVLGNITQIKPIFNLSETPGSIKIPAPEFGQHNIQILQQLGYSQIEIEQFIKDNIIGTYERLKK